ncbi:MAG: secretin N-terminal domain-containing protein, partial [Thermodesulfobacteriota bacterium]
MKFGIGIRQMVCVAACAAVLLGAPASWAEEPRSRADLIQKIRERRGLPGRRMAPGDQGQRAAQASPPEQAGTEPPRPATEPAGPEVKTPRVPSKTSLDPTPSVGGQVEGNLVSLDFNDVDLTVFIKFISEITGKNFIVDQNVRTKITVICPAKIPVDDAYRVFQSVLEVHGFATVEAGDIIKVVKAGDARSKSIQTGMVQEDRSPEDRLVTQIIPLKYADANEIKGLFTPLVSKDSVLLAYPSTNMLILTDTHSNIQRLLKILEAIDVTGIERQISV